MRALRPEAEVNVADVVAVALAAVSAAAGVVIWVRRPKPSAVPTRAEIGEAAGVLADLVARQWRLEARRRVLDDPEPIPVRWRLRADRAVTSARRLVAREGTVFIAHGCGPRERLLARLLVAPAAGLVGLAVVQALNAAGGEPLPWRLMRFLDDAHRVGLLRAVGPVYQFRHAELRDHLGGGTR
ncbi:hypothetical protein [Spongiactinospora sp. TRM90649]|uniref:hypothetical protein n=1 Tax=Spongiactinospora sp. TRM90649 TaxID=3031114 RepID=UPI0023F6FE66|nr:hypothetical protein [Spongiactinospora sp. TRM90649]MDF5754668.1 hypothetical protein [Spongiactinospora sp. TRM90649]